MAGTITALKTQKKDKERVNVFLDDQFAFAVTCLVAAKLRRGQYLSDADIEALEQGDQRDKAYDRAVRYLARRPRSRAEMERYLANKGYAAGVVEATIHRLLDQQYLDDEAFARFWVENRQKFRPRSEHALRYELRQKGVARHVIDAVVVDLDEEELAWAAVAPKLLRWEKLTDQALQKKIIGFLSRRGFSYEVAHTIFSRACDALDGPERPEI